MPTELFTQLLIFLTTLLGFGRYIVGVWYKLKEKDKILESRLLLKTIDRLDLSLKEIKGEFIIMRSELKTHRTDLMSIVQVQKSNQKNFDAFVAKMSEFVTSANTRFEKLENFGTVKVKD